MDNSIHSVVACANYYGLFSLDEIEAESQASKVALFMTQALTACTLSKCRRTALAAILFFGESNGAACIMHVLRSSITGTLPSGNLYDF